MVLRFLIPLLAATAFGLVMYLLSARRLRRELDAASTPLDAPRLTPALQRLAGVLDLPQIPVHVQEIPGLNGLAAPDGRVFVTRGFIEQMEADKIAPEEIASVVAHEIGHVALGHSRRRMIGYSAQNALRAGLGLVLARMIPVVGGYLAQMLVGLLAAKLSRDDEFEADAYAAALLTKAGIGIGPQISLFEKLGAKTPGQAGAAWLMSHPSMERRIAALQKLEARWSIDGRPG